MRIGIFGGSFDPVHYGHLLVAEFALEQLQLDRVLFVPAFVSPFKQQSRPASGKDRLAMLELAIAGHPNFELDPREVLKPEVSYTITTLAEVQQETPSATLFLIMGADAVAEFHRWKHPDRILELATLAIAMRGGIDSIDWQGLKQVQQSKGVANPASSGDHSERAQKNKISDLSDPPEDVETIQLPQMELSSSEIRTRVELGKSIRFQTPPAVVAYIRTHQLYRSLSETEVQR